MTPRQIADAVVCAVGDAQREYKDLPHEEMRVRMADAVLDTLREHGIDLMLSEQADDRGQFSTVVRMT